MSDPANPVSAARLTRRRLFAISLVPPLGSSLLVACGGGGSEDPTISLAAIPLSGAEGAVITLSAQADDDDGIKEVSFYRVTDTLEVLLATYTAAPFLFQTTIPAGTAGTTIQYLARAKDTDDNTADSARISITVNT
jgi:Bacterial Ig domain